MWTDTFQVRKPQSLRLAGIRVPGGYSLYSRVQLSGAFLVCIFYTSVGGMKVVMWTDTFQVRTTQSLQLAGVRVPCGYSLPVIFLVCIFYTSMGGMKAVMWTDTFQVRTLKSLRLAGVRVPGGYSLPGHLPGVNLLHLRGRDEGGHVDRHLSGKDTAES